MVVIDWTQVMVGDPRLDLSWTLMIMGDYSQEAWRDRILTAYHEIAGDQVEDLAYFTVLSYMKLLGSTAISLRVGSDRLGMRRQTIASIQEQAPILDRLARHLEQTTGLHLPPVTPG